MFCQGGAASCPRLNVSYDGSRLALPAMPPPHQSIPSYSGQVGRGRRHAPALPAISVFDTVDALREWRDTLPSRFSPLPTGRDVRGASSEGTVDG